VILLAPFDLSGEEDSLPPPVAASLARSHQGADRIVVASPIIIGSGSSAPRPKSEDPTKEHRPK
jgi:hypothetical protein